MHWLLSTITDEDLLRFATVLGQLVTVVLIIRHNRHIRTELEPKVDNVQAVVTRKLGDRPPHPPEPWNGVDRRIGRTPPP